MRKTINHRYPKQTEKSKSSDNAVNSVNPFTLWLGFLGLPRRLMTDSIFLKRIPFDKFARIMARRKFQIRKQKMIVQALMKESIIITYPGLRNRPRGFPFADLWIRCWFTNILVRNYKRTKGISFLKLHKNHRSEHIGLFSVMNLFPETPLW